MIRYVSRKEFAARASISLSFFDLLLRQGCIPAGHQFGRKKFWLATVVDAWLILASGHPFPLPDLPPESMAQVLASIEKLNQRNAELFEKQKTKRQGAAPQM